MRHEEPVISHGVYVVEIVVSKVKMTAVSLRVRQSQADVGLRTRGSGGGSDGECDGDGHQVGAAIVIRPHLRGICRYSIFNQRQVSDLRSGSPSGGVVTHRQTNKTRRI